MTPTLPRALAAVALLALAPVTVTTAKDAAADAAGSTELQQVSEALANQESFEISTTAQWDAAMTTNMSQVTLVAFIQQGCGHCKSMEEPWREATKAANREILMVTVDVENKAMAKIVGENMIEGTPHVRIYRRGTTPITFQQPKDKENLLQLVKQLTYKNSAMLMNKVAVRDFVAKAMKDPNESDLTAVGSTIGEDQEEEAPKKTKIPPVVYVLVAPASEADGVAFTEVASYAMQQGDMQVKYAICKGALAKACGLKPGHARMLRYDLPEEMKEKGVHFQDPLTNVRAFHIFSRGGGLPIYSHLDSVRAVTFYNVATIPVVYVIKTPETTTEQIPTEYEFELTGWKHIGRAVVVTVDADFLRKEIKWWGNEIASAADGAETYPQVRICKFAISTTCYKMEQVGPGPGDTIAREDIDDLIDAYYADELEFEPRSEDPETVGAGAGAETEHSPTPLVGSTYLSWVDEEVDTDRLVYLTHPECGSCKQIDPIFNNLAKIALSRTDVLSFATMQCDKNDPPADVEVHNYPKILYYKEDADAGVNVRPSELFMLVRDLLFNKTGLELAQNGVEPAKRPRSDEL